MENCEKTDKNSILEPLNLSDHKSSKNVKKIDLPTLCLFCEASWLIPRAKDLYLKHLFLEHRFVISDEADIPDLEFYLNFWRKEFKDHEIEEFCTVMLLKQTPDGKVISHDEKYYLLSEVLPKDAELRDNIKKKCIEKVLEQHQFERTDENYHRECLYCRDVVDPTRHLFVEHLYSKHGLSLGKPENLVFIDELIEVVQGKLETLICLFCEKMFKDRSVLKEHMRKKFHKRINPDNKAYDKFFLINYNLDKIRYSQTLKPKPKESSEEPACFNNEEQEDDHWSDWGDEDEGEMICLFCSTREKKSDDMRNHLLKEHEFQLETKKYNFYEKIKFINYIRRQVHLLRCISCNEHFEKSEDLQSHMINQRHFDSDRKLWDKPEYFFPTYEDDKLLYTFDDNLNENDELIPEDSIVIAEDSLVNVNQDAELLSRENFEL